MIREANSTQVPRGVRSEDRITVDAIRYYIPLFHAGDAAVNKLETGEHTETERAHLLTRAALRDAVVEKITSLCQPLMTKEINNLIKNSHLKGREDLFDLLYYAGINGMLKGLRHFDVDKLNTSSTNYLFQWIVTYAKKELLVAEAPFGVAPSRFQQLKKISAVRKRMSEEMGRYASNEEVLEYFLSGKADIKNMNGRKSDKDKPYEVNRRMTLEIVAEQEYFEKNLNHVSLLDPLEDHAAEVKMSEAAATPFAETLFGVFVSEQPFTVEAVAVLMSDLSSPDITDAQMAVVESMDKKTYRSLSAQWKACLSDGDGVFYRFLTQNRRQGFDEFDVNSVVSFMTEFSRTHKVRDYSRLFEKGAVV